MKKLLVLALLCFAALPAKAFDYEEYYRHMADPFYMPKFGQVVIKAGADISAAKNTTADTTYDFYTAYTQVTIGFADWLELGGGVAHRWDKDKDPVTNDRESGWLNPYAYGRIRLVDRVFTVDFFAKAQFDAFDTVEEGGIESGTQKYDAGFILGARFNRVSFGGKIYGGYWYEGSELAVPENDYMVNLGAEVFVAFRPINFLNLGASFGVTNYAFDESDYSFLEERLSLSADLSIIEGRLSLGAYYNFVTNGDNDMKNVNEFETSTFGVRLMSAF